MVDGRVVESPNVLKGHRTPVMDPNAVAAQEVTRKKMAEKRALVSAQTKTTVGFDSLGVVTSHEDTAWINEWLSQRQQMIPFVASLMRNGHIERAFKKQESPPEAVASTLGRQVVRQAGMRFRAISGKQAVWFLDSLYPARGVQGWFKGEDSLATAVASKCLNYVLAVRPGTPLPTGHEHCTYEGPLLAVFRERVQVVGPRLFTHIVETTRETLDDLSDYFSLKGGPLAVVCNVDNSVATVNMKLVGHSDWIITHADDYAQAELISESAGVQLKLARAYELDQRRPLFDHAFNFPQQSDGSSMAISAASGVVSSFAGLEAAAAAVAAQRAAPANVQPPDA